MNIFVSDYHSFELQCPSFPCNILINIAEQEPVLCKQIMVKSKHRSSCQLELASTCSLERGHAPSARSDFRNSSRNLHPLHLSTGVSKAHGRWTPVEQRAAVRAAGGTQVVQPFEVAALALPVTDRVIDEIQLGQAAEIGDRENAGEHRLQTRVVAFLRQHVHLQKPLVTLLLDFDQIRDRNGCFDLGEINAFTNRNVSSIAHVPLLG